MANFELKRNNLRIFNRDTVSIEVLNERAESVILAKKLEEETKKKPKD
jgi:hypothetical protein